MSSGFTFVRKLLYRQFGGIAVAVLVLCSLQAFALHARSTRRYPRRNNHHRPLVVWSPLLRGSHESMLRQNEEIDRLGLPRIADEQQLETLIRQRELVPIQENTRLRIHPDLQPENRFCKPWTLRFLADLSREFYSQFHQPIQVNSAVRTAEQQHKLRRYNHNAAPDSGDTPSSHLAGLTIDISRRGMTRNQRKWVERYLYQLRQRGFVETAEERRQPVFHIMVARRYGQWREASLEHPSQPPVRGTQHSNAR